MRDSDEVVGGSDDVTVHLDSIASAVARSAQTADALHPAERFLDPLSDPLTDRVTRMARGAGVERGTARACLIPRHMRSDFERATGSDEVTGIVALVPAQRDPLRSGQALVSHCDRRAALGVSVCRLYLKVDQDAVAFSISALPE